MKTFWTVILGALLAGCSAVTMREPFPETKLPEEVRQNLNGTWMVVGEGLVYYMDTSINRKPTLAWVDENESGLFLEKARIYFTQTNDSLYACMPTDKGVTNEFLFGELKVEEDLVVIWTPSENIFERLVESGKLEAGRNEDVLTLESPAADILKLVSTNSAAFNYKGPILLRRLD